MPMYARNKDLHRDLGIPMVSEEIKRFAAKHEDRLHRHVNAEALQLLDNQHRQMIEENEAVWTSIVHSELQRKQSIMRVVKISVLDY